MSDIPDKCPFCGADYHGEGKTDKWEWTQYKCSTEFENGEWLQDDDCRIAQLDNTITALRTELAAAKQRVAELEAKDKREQIDDLFARRDACSSLLRQRAMSSCSRDYDMEERLEQIEKELAALLPPDRITHIPQESDDGEMH